MKRFLTFLLIFAVIVSAQTLSVCAEAELELIIDGEKQVYDNYLAEASLGNGNYVLLAPIRNLCEALEASAQLSETDNKIVCEKDGKSITMKFGDKTAVKNGSTVTLAAAPKYIGSVAYVPAEACGEALGYHVFRERSGRRVRIVSTTRSDSPADETTLKKGTAELNSEVHRPVPVNFDRSTQPDDLIYLREDWTGAVKEASGSGIVPDGEVVFNQEDFENGVKNSPEWHDIWRYYETVPVDKNKISINVSADGSYIGEGTNGVYDLPFDKAFRITSHVAEYYDQDKVVYFENKLLPAATAKDNYVMTFYARLASGGDPDSGKGKIGIGIQGVGGQTIELTKEWQRFDFLFTRMEGEKEIRMNPAVYVQAVDIGGFEVKNVGQDADLSYFDAKKEDFLPSELDPDAEWRKEALDRIEDVRKGDFTVIVKDKDGNPVPGAELKFDMFEHEFRLGVTMDIEYIDPDTSPSWNPKQQEQLLSKVGSDFNTMAVGNGLKWPEYATDPTRAERIIAAAREQGIKYFRGHALWMPSTSYDTEPKDMYALLTDSDTPVSERYETLKGYISDHFTTMNEKFPYIYSWDVTNEILGRTLFSDVFGTKMNEEVYKIANETLTNGQLLALCDCQQFETADKYEEYWDMLDNFREQGINYDMLTMQGHMAIGSGDIANNVRPTELLKVWDRFAYEYNKKFEITEYSLGAYNDEYGIKGQGDATRDILIAAFSHPACTGFSLWWLSDCWLDWDSQFRLYNKELNGDNGAGVSPFYGEMVEEKPGLAVFRDLFYNKWWTRDAQAVTDSNGKGSVRGFYGDYDITVTVNGQKVKTTMAAFHKGYENVLTVTLD